MGEPLGSGAVEQCGARTRWDDARESIFRGVSPYGVFDPVGNVFQWTSSAFADGRTILKGCAWDDEPGLCRPAFRHGRPPESRHILIGFRRASPNVAGGQWH